ncbi:hypothetical protein EZ456_07485 [Pedobacter psychrodurus]|uniref:Uncharacterized protein n=1 Tax=Pedobacter psychrodurus TaxID=2530456 RepID=A0A4R0Q4B0_9SPHI|nr:hypothetical protein [Pedobacter psychrodurus]TCD27781.1 hypothetical protein EZ456_07485 [Pedobacter psychrodurus]
MSIIYFKPRDRFDFSVNTLDIGNPITWSQSHFLKHLFKRIFAIRYSRFEEFYQHHLDYYLKTVDNSTEESFFKNFFETVDRQLKVLNSRDVYAKNHVKTQRELIHLEKLRNLLISFDKWNIHKSFNDVVAKQELDIFILRQQIEMLKADLKKATALETTQFIDIPKGGFLSFVDLIIQMQEIKLPSGKELVFAEFQIAWVKMICKYFREDHKAIDFDRVRRYFPKDRRNPGSRSSSVPSDQHLFEIREIKRK